ncbi:xanthine dehydrogenase family protein [bacterium]|nr:xanthine dehydrogenase family protein [bacterium]
MRVIGKGVNREDGYEKVTGRALFADDHSFPGMLYARVKRSIYPHARILEIDTSRAKALPGVLAVATARDIPGMNVVHVVIDDQPLLADKTVMYVGEPLAVVAAETPEIAEQACDLIDVKYSKLPAVLDILKARGKSSPKIYKDNNVFAHHKIRKGNIEEGFKKADIVLEQIYRTPYQEHAYLEPQGMVAVPRYGSTMEIYGTMQCPFYVQQAVADITGLDLSRVRVVQTYTGGAFGGKEDVPSLVAGQAALLAYHTQRPVKLIYSREEDIISMSKRHPAWIKYRSGVTKDGKLTAVEIEFLFDSGAYSTLSSVVLWRGIVHSVGPYNVPHVKVDAYAVATNKVPCGAFRGFGSPQVIFAAETQMNELAAKLDMDPAQFRSINLLQEGDLTATSQLLDHSVGIGDTLKAALGSSNWRDKRKGSGGTDGSVRKGIGLSTVFYGVGLGAGGKQMARAGAYVQLLRDGSAQFAVGTTEMGQGMRTVLSQIVAEQLGIPYKKVYMIETDTSRVPDSGPTVASRATVMSGNALIKACAPLREILLKRAGIILGQDPQFLIFQDEMIHLEEHPEIAVPLMKVIEDCHHHRENMSHEGWFISPETSWDPETGQGKAYFIYSWATNIAEVEVDIETGQVKVLKITAAHDMGKAINPLLVEGQIEGGALQGMGYGLMEEVLVDEGRIINPNFSTYIIPTVIDAPEFQPIIVEKPFRDGPYGAKGFGELPLMGVAPAVTAAISHALGITLHEIPATPERILEAIQAAKKANLNG